MLCEARRRHSGDCSPHCNSVCVLSKLVAEYLMRVTEVGILFANRYLYLNTKCGS